MLYRKLIYIGYEKHSKILIFETFKTRELAASPFERLTPAYKSNENQSKSQKLPNIVHNHQSYFKSLLLVQNMKNQCCIAMKFIGFDLIIRSTYR